MSSSFDFERGVFSMSIDSEITEAEIVASTGLDSSSLVWTIYYSSSSDESYDMGVDFEI